MKYQTVIDLENEHNAQNLILREVKQGSTVLEFGPGSGAMTRYLKEVLGCDVYAVEHVQEFFEASRPFTKEILLSDIERFEWCERWENRHFDCIIFADVLEHLINPWTVVSKSIDFLKDNGIMLASIPNISHSSVILNLVENNFPYQDSGLLDKTHLRFFTYNSARELFEKPGLFLHKEMATYRPIGKTLPGVHVKFQELKSLLEQKKYADVFQFVFVIKKTVEGGVENLIQSSHTLYEQETVLGLLPAVYFDFGEGFSEQTALRHFQQL